MPTRGLWGGDCCIVRDQLNLRYHLIEVLGLVVVTPIQENFIYKKQGPSPISLVRATRIFSKAKTLTNFFDLSLTIGDIPIYPF